MSSFVLIDWLCIYSQPRPVRLMMGAKPCLRLIHYLRLIYLQLNITPWITVHTCHMALWTSLDQFTVCNFLFTKTHRKITVVMAELQVPFVSLVILEKENKIATSVWCNTQKECLFLCKAMVQHLSQKDIYFCLINGTEDFSSYLYFMLSYILGNASKIICLLSCAH